MGMCGSCCSDGQEENQKLESGALQEGPVANRGCTDIFCIPILVIAQLIFVVVTVMGVADGDPQKLYLPRDYRGNFCGLAENWNGGGDMSVGTKLSFTMNVTSSVDELMKQLVCSSAAKVALVDGGGGVAPLLTTQEAKDAYLCDCCLTPCRKCEGSLDKGEDLTSTAAVSAFASKMTPLTSPGGGASLFDPSGPLGGKFTATEFWAEATKYFNQVCLPSCATDSESIASEATTRSYTYKPMRDDPLYDPWELLLNANSNSLTSALKTVISTSFTFTAFPKSVCPYEDASLCVPFPGLKYGEISSGADYCTFGMAADVIGVMGDAAASALASTGLTAIADASTESFGKWAGDFQKTLDTFVVVSLLAFIIGIIFLVVLRFTIGICVWIAVGCTVLFFVFGGAFLFVVSGQCAGSGILETGHQVAVAVAVAGATAASNAISGNQAASEALNPELNGTDYRGAQRHTRYGLTCLQWDSQSVLPQYTSTNYPTFAMAGNSFCRNPSNAGDANIAKTIWCITSDVNFPWQECTPIGVIQPECTQGYEITGQNMRDALYYSSFVVWALGLIWCVLILCFASRIRLAIALNKVAAIYLAHHPFVLLVPIVQGLIGIAWCIIWFFGASFLLSQVPSGYVPTGYFATYAEAYGTGGSCAFWEFGDQCSGTPGKCTDQWPTGSVWKDNTCNLNTVTGEYECWRCAPPRYNLDTRFAISFFVFLWNNAFNVALGQIIIAMCVSTWFFAPREKKTEVRIFTAVKTIFRYHVGSVAFGSFIVAVVQFIRYMMKYFEKQASAQKNRVMVLVLKILQCCILCFERCIKFLNKNAYIQIALHGTNFCTSARKAFFLILRNALRFGVIASLSGVIHMIGFICIVSGTCVIGYFLVRAMHSDISPFIPLCCFMFMGYNVASLFMGVFGLAVDTALQCFIACEEMGMSGDFVPDCLSNFVKKQKEKQQEAAAA